MRKISIFKNNAKLYTEDYTENFVENISINYLTNDVSYGIILVSTNNTQQRRNTT